MALDPTDTTFHDEAAAAHSRIADTLFETCGVPAPLAPRIAFVVLRDLCQNPEALASIRRIVEHGAGLPDSNPPLPPFPRLMIRPGSSRARKRG